MTNQQRYHPISGACFSGGRQVSSIVTWTGTGNIESIGMYYVAPSMIIGETSSGFDWPVYHSSLLAGSLTRLSTNEASNAWAYFNSSDPYHYYILDVGSSGLLLANMVV